MCKVVASVFGGFFLFSRFFVFVFCFYVGFTHDTEYINGTIPYVLFCVRPLLKLFL